MAKNVLKKKRFGEDDFSPGELERLSSVLHSDIPVVIAWINEYKGYLVELNCFSIISGKLVMAPETLFALLFTLKTEEWKIGKKIGVITFRQIVSLLIPEALKILQTNYVPKDIFEAAQTKAESEIASIRGRYEASERDYLNENEKRKAAETENQRLREMVRHLDEIVHANIDKIAPPGSH
jgi:hypothetical protein